MELPKWVLKNRELRSKSITFNYHSEEWRNFYFNNNNYQYRIEFALYLALDSLKKITKTSDLRKKDALAMRGLRRVNNLGNDL